MLEYNAAGDDPPHLIDAQSTSEISLVPVFPWLLTLCLELSHPAREKTPAIRLIYTPHDFRNLNLLRFSGKKYQPIQPLLIAQILHLNVIVIVQQVYVKSQAVGVLMLHQGPDLKHQLSCSSDAAWPSVFLQLHTVISDSS
eukprot:g35347.t1